MLPILLLENEADYAIGDTIGKNVTPSRKAYIVDFARSGGGQPIRTWVPVSNAKIEKGMLWVAEWLLEPRRQGIGAIIAAGHKCLNGVAIKDEVAPLGTERSEMKESPIYKGYFTVEREGDKHRTFRFTTYKGKTTIALMTGRNNTADYTKFGYVDGENIRFWRTPTFHGMDATLPISQDDIRECYKAILNDLDAAGLRYARESKRCSRCNKELTTPESLDAGLGPICDGMRYRKK